MEAPCNLRPSADSGKPRGLAVRLHLYFSRARITSPKLLTPEAIVTLTSFFASLNLEHRNSGMLQGARRIRASDGHGVRSFRRAAPTTETAAAAASGLENQAGE